MVSPAKGDKETRYVAKNMTEITLTQLLLTLPLLVFVDTRRFHQVMISRVVITARRELAYDRPPGARAILKLYDSFEMMITVMVWLCDQV